MGIFRKKPNHKPSLFEIENAGDFRLELSAVLKIYDREDCDEKFIAGLNHPQRVLALCMMLEDCGQTGMIFNFFEEFPSYVQESINALKEIGALKSAELIKQAWELQPKGCDGNEWRDGTSEKLWEKLEKIDRKFAGYPDGHLDPLYKQYAEKHKKVLL